MNTEKLKEAVNVLIKDVSELLDQFELCIKAQKKVEGFDRSDLETRLLKTFTETGKALYLLSNECPELWESWEGLINRYFKVTKQYDLIGIEDQLGIDAISAASDAIQSMTIVMIKL